jgi:hypothetical protein
MMRKGRRSKPPGVGICRVLMVVRRAGCVSFSPVSRLAQIGTVWSALETQPLWASNSDLIASATRVDPPGDAAATASQTADVARPIFSENAAVASKQRLGVNAAGRSSGQRDWPSGPYASYPFDEVPLMRC